MYETEEEACKEAHVKANVAKRYDKEEAELQERLRERLGQEANELELQKVCDADKVEEEARIEANFAK